MLVAFLFGLVVTLIAPKFIHSVEAFLDQLGHAFMIAAILAWLLNVTEMKEFFVRLAAQTMIDRRFLEGLKPSLLKEVRSQISEVLVRDAVNNEAYRWTDLHECTERFLFEHCLPTEKPGSGLYRRNLTEEVFVRVVSLHDVIAEVGGSISAGTEDTAAPLYRIERIVEFQVVSPKTELEHLSLPIGFETHDEPSSVPLNKILRIWAGSCENDAKEIDLGCHREDGQVRGSAEQSLPVAEGICRVWRRSVEFGSHAFLLSKMSMLTHGMTLRLSLEHRPEDKLSASGWLMALGPLPEATKLPNGIRISYDDWLFEDHGYFVYWYASPPVVSDVQAEPSTSGTGPHIRNVQVEGRVEDRTSPHSRTDEHC